MTDLIFKTVVTTGLTVSLILIFFTIYELWFK